MSSLRVSVLIPSLRRPATLARCLKSLGQQTRLPDEVIVVWQGDDTSTRDVVAGFEPSGFEIKALHQPQPGIVPAENLALSAASGDIIFLIDDDAVAPRQWIERHLTFYADPRVGAVGGPADNFRPDGTPYPKRTADPIGKLRWFGKAEGNMYDHPPEWKQRRPREVDHLVGYNFSFRRLALDRFEEGLRPYWQQFELDACLQIKSGGFKIIYDFGNCVEHYPTNSAYDGSRDPMQEVRTYNPAFNQAFVLAKHSKGVLRPIRLGYLLGVGSIGSPGLAAFLVALARFRAVRRESTIFAKCVAAKLDGWRAGS